MIQSRTRIGLALAAASMLTAAAPISALICSMDQRPAATLLVPYFEVDVANCGAREVDTSFAIVNLNQIPALAHVTIWSDWAVPVFSFSVYLTGWDTQTIFLGNVLCDGQLPATGSAVSNLGAYSVFGTFPGCNDTTIPGDPPVYPDPAISANERAHLQAWLTGNPSPQTGDCAGADFGDGRARGYITIDSGTACNVNFPNEPAYYTNGYLSLNNMLVGDYARIDSNLQVAAQFPAVSMEADASLTGLVGGPTFYGGFNSTILGFEYSDGREPLPTSFSAEFDTRSRGETHLTVWREVGGPSPPVLCGNVPSWYPVQNVQASPLVWVDEESNPVGVPANPDTVFGLATQRVAVTPLVPPVELGWVHLNLQSTEAPVWSNSAGQAWVAIEQTKSTGARLARHASTLDGQCPATTVFGIPPVILDPSEP